LSLSRLECEPLVERPVCTLLGGPNGSDKSSIYAALNLPGRFVNADLVARRINPIHPESVSIAAGRLVLRQLDELMVSGESFVYETTLSSHQSIDLMRRAREAGYEVNLAFVALRDADLHVERVAFRVAAGGHDIPQPSIRRRYETSLARLFDAIRLSDGTAIFDNSEVSGPFLLILMTAGVIETNNFDETRAFHSRIASRVGEALGMEVGSVFAAAKPVPL
jgi:predicted ABC-type ATPase